MKKPESTNSGIMYRDQTYTAATKYLTMNEGENFGNLKETQVYC